MEVMTLQELIKKNGSKLTKDEEKLLNEYDVELIFPVSLEETSKRKAEALAEIVYETLGPANSKKLYEMISNGEVDF